MRGYSVINKWKKEFEAWKQSEKGQLQLTVSFDMGRNKKNSGNRYDSLSSHFFMVGYRSQKIIAATITAK